jgi:hypothetical protein
MDLLIDREMYQARKEPLKSAISVYRYGQRRPIAIWDLDPGQ